MKIIDLSHVISPAIAVFPGTEPPRFEKMDVEGYRELKMTMFTHTGTHIDAPYHIIKGTKSLDDFPVEKFVGRAFIIDCRNFVGKQISLTHLAPYQSAIEKVSFLILRTGWAEKWNGPEYFEGFPTLTAEAAEWLSGFRLNGIGLDCISLDPVADLSLPNHHIVLAKEILIIENLTNLQSIPNGEFTFQCLPLKIEKADGSPVRAVAVVD